MCADCSGSVDVVQGFGAKKIFFFFFKTGHLTSFTNIF